MDWTSVPDPLPPAGVEVNVRATFAGPALFVSKNSLSPKLTLYEDRVEIKVKATSSFPYAELSVDAKTAWMTNNLILLPAGKRKGPTANVREKEDLLGVLGFLQAKGVAMSSRAQALLDG